MRKKKSNPPSASPDTPAHGLAFHWRLIISILVIVHLTAVFVPPIGLQAQSRVTNSRFVRSLQWALGWYIDAAYLNHGYAFFGPDPGPSHLIEYTVEFEDDRPALTQTFPDLKRHWPRLLYHRHFMLSEHLNSSFTQPEAPPRPQRFAGQSDLEWNEIEQRWKANVERWDRARTGYEARWRSFQQHLEETHGGQVTMTRVRHLIHPPVARHGKVDLKDDESYLRAGRDELFSDARGEEFLLTQPGAALVPNPQLEEIVPGP